MANYVLLERIELNADTASVTFSNIPQTGYTDLKIEISARTTHTAPSENIMIRPNGATTNLSSKRLAGTGSAAASYNSATLLYAFEADGGGATANTFSNGEIYIPNYNSTTTFKSFSTDGVMENNAATAYMTMGAGLWSSNSAITSLTLIPESGYSFVSGSTFSLYGIANASTTPAIAPKADGGNVIATDGTYWYHAFLSNGTFTPQVGLSADVLTIAGGGGGGGGNGGGGGAGGVLAFASQSLLASNYTIQVGAGGTSGAAAGTSNGGNGTNSFFGSLTASVGGGGGAGGSATSGSAGGSGGGAGASPGVGGSGTSGQGFAGASVIGGGPAYGRPSGGGAGGAGNDGQSSAGAAGGAPVNSYTGWGSLSAAFTATGLGVSGFIAGGGGGGVYSGAGYSGAGGTGTGGGGSLANGSSNGGAGTVNTGGGGAGGGYGGSGLAGGAGGSGIVIIRYAVA